MRVLWALLLVSCASVERRPVTKDERAEVRRRFDDIVRTIGRDARDPMPAGDSLSKQVHDLLQHDAAVLRAVEADVWNASRGASIQRLDDLDARPEEQVIRFLHELPPRNSAWFEHGFAIEAGAVVHEPDSGGGFNPWTRAVETADVEFEALVGDHPLRAYSLPRAQVLFAALASPAGGSFIDLRDIDLAMAFGEACAADANAAAELVQRANRDMTDERLLVALGWCGTAAAVDVLKRCVAELPGRDWRTMPWQSYPLKAATCALRHASHDSLEALLGTLPNERSDLIVATMGGTELVMRRLAALDAARDAASRHKAIARLCRVDYVDAQIPSGDDGARLFRGYLEGVESGDPRLRHACLTAVETTLFGRYSGGGGGDSYSSREGSIDQTDLRQLGSYCGPEPLLRMIVEDLALGRIEFFARGKKPDGPRVAFLKEYSWPARGSGVPIKGREMLPIRLAAEWVEVGLRLRLTNEHSGRVAVDAVGMRYGGVETVKETITYGDGTTRVRHPITLRLGWLNSAAVHDSSLEVLEPGASYEWVLPVRAEFHGRDEIDVSNWGLDVLGPSTVPVVRFGMTIVR